MAGWVVESLKGKVEVLGCFSLNHCGREGCWELGDWVWTSESVSLSSLWPWRGTRQNCRWPPGLLFSHSHNVACALSHYYSLSQSHTLSLSPLISVSHPPTLLLTHFLSLTHSLSHSLFLFNGSNFVQMLYKTGMFSLMPFFKKKKLFWSFGIVLLLSCRFLEKSLPFEQWFTGHHFQSEENDASAWARVHLGSSSLPGLGRSFLDGGKSAPPASLLFPASQQKPCRSNEVSCSPVVLVI